MKYYKNVIGILKKKACVENVVKEENVLVKLIKEMKCEKIY